MSMCFFPFFLPHFFFVFSLILIFFSWRFCVWGSNVLATCSRVLKDLVFFMQRGIVWCNTLCCNVEQCVLQCISVCCSVLQCIAVYCSVLQCVAVCCSVLQCISVCCSVFQCVAVSVAVPCFGMAQYKNQSPTKMWAFSKGTEQFADTVPHHKCMRVCNRVIRFWTWISIQYKYRPIKKILQRIAKHCNTMQHTGIRYNTLQHTATRCNTLQYAATCCNTLQHVATRCNTLQRT